MRNTVLEVFRDTRIKDIRNFKDRKDFNDFTETPFQFGSSAPPFRNKNIYIMGSFSQFLIALGILVCMSEFGKCDLEVQLLHVVFRHGDKVPHREFQNYPTDPYRDHSYLPIGNGDLTNQGKLREYRIGTMLRERYNRYFGPNYWPELIYARSTDVPRTQLSLQLVLAGLFPPSERQTWNSRLPWIPVATFSVAHEVDNLLFPHLCHRYREEYARFLKQDQIQEVLHKYRHVFSYLTERTGKKVETTGSVSYLFNLFKEQAAQNLTLPEWTGKVYPNPMKDILALDFKLRSYTRTLKRLNGGTLLRKVVEDIEEYRAGKLHPAERKAFLFSGHEVNVAAFARVLGLDEPIIPAYGSTVILETLRDRKGTYYVRVLLWTGVTEQLVIQNIPGCSDICPFDKFLHIIKDVIPDEAEYHCRRGNYSHIDFFERKVPLVSAAVGRSSLFNSWHYLLALILAIRLFSR